MNVRQWEIWKARPPGFEKDHWFVIISGPERLDSQRHPHINGLACYTLRGQPLKTDVLLDRAEGFDGTTVCQCDLFFYLEKTKLHSPLGAVTWERQQQLRAKLKEVFRF
ncbi:MAG: hypothetical protein WBN22_01000 [Verrucomicrobiia bacterium]